jgi:hypothetical protein
MRKGYSYPKDREAMESAKPTKLVLLSGRQVTLPQCDAKILLALRSKEEQEETLAFWGYAVA